jgi:hypothetical protein
MASWRLSAGRWGSGCMISTGRHELHICDPGPAETDRAAGRLRSLGCKSRARRPARVPVSVFAPSSAATEHLRGVPVPSDSSYGFVRWPPRRNGDQLFASAVGLMTIRHSRPLSVLTSSRRADQRALPQRLDAVAQRRAADRLAAPSPTGDRQRHRRQDRRESRLPAHTRTPASSATSGYSTVCRRRARFGSFSGTRTGSMRRGAGLCFWLPVGAAPPHRWPRLVRAAPLMRRPTVRRPLRWRLPVPPGRWQRLHRAKRSQPCRQLAPRARFPLPPTARPRPSWRALAHPVSLRLQRAHQHRHPWRRLAHQETWYPAPTARQLRPWSAPGRQARWPHPPAPARPPHWRQRAPAARLAHQPTRRPRHRWPRSAVKVLLRGRLIRSRRQSWQRWGPAAHCLRRHPPSPPQRRR